MYNQAVYFFTLEFLIALVKAKSCHPPCLFVGETGRVVTIPVTVNITGQNISEFVPLTSKARAVSIDYHMKYGQVFWIDGTAYKLQSASINGSNVKTLLNDTFKGVGLAVNWIHDVLYFAYDNTLVVSNLDGSNRTMLIENVGFNFVVKLDMLSRMMFFGSVTSKKIETADLDGKNRTLLADTSFGIMDIVLDYYQKKIYWISLGRDFIESIDYTGANRNTLPVKIKGSVPAPTRIALLNNSLFINDMNYGAALQIDISKGIYIGERPTHKAFGISIFDKTRQPNLTYCPYTFGGLLKISNCSVVKGATCNFACPHGYILEGKAILTCLVPNTMPRIGLWDDKLPTCQAVQCPILNASLALQKTSCSNIHGGSCNFTCSTGYNLVGNATLNCLVTTSTPPKGVWDSHLPTCQAVQCPILNASLPLHNPSCSNIYGGACNFTCSHGYNLVGNATLNCLATQTKPYTGLWDGQIPTCQVIKCPTLSPYFPLQKTACVATYGGTCNFTCSHGHILVGNATLNCLATRTTPSNGLWDFQMPTCEAVQCPILNASLALQNTSCSNIYGGSCNFTCSTGYNLVGNATLKCLATNSTPPKGAWDSHLPTCQAVQCPILNASLPLHNPSCSNIYGGACNFTCSHGYNLVGNATLNCSATRTTPYTGLWDGQMPTCQITNCPTLSPYFPLQKTACVATYGGTCNFTCSHGHILVGNATLNCLATRTTPSNGLWDFQMPTCEAVKCPISNASLALQNTSCSNIYGGRCNFTCSTGYNLVGNATLNCLATNSTPPKGVWDSHLPTCQAVQCPILNASLALQKTSCSNIYGGSCNFICSTGYNLVGNATLNCLVTNSTPAKGVWDSHFPTCQAVQCPILNASLPLHNTSCSNFYGETCSFSCSYGYTLVGNATLQCLATRTTPYKGLWDGQMPTCKVTKCPTLSPDFPLQKTACVATHGGTCNFTCSHGHILVGNATLNCLATRTTPSNGLWDFQMPACKVEDSAGGSSSNISNELTPIAIGVIVGFCALVVIAIVGCYIFRRFHNHRHEEHLNSPNNAPSKKGTAMAMYNPANDVILKDVNML